MARWIKASESGDLSAIIVAYIVGENNGLIYQSIYLVNCLLLFTTIIYNLYLSTIIYFPILWYWG